MKKQESDQGAPPAQSKVTAEEIAKHLSLKRLVCPCLEDDCPRFVLVVDAIRAALAERDTDWREALLLWSGGSPLNTSDEFGAKLRALIASDAAEPPNE